MAQTYFSATKRRKENTESELHRKLQRVEPRSNFQLKIEQNAVLRMTRKEFKPPKGRVIVAAFDLDGTLITTKSGYKFAGDGNDWKLLPEIEEKLNKKLSELSEEQVLFILFTNQGGVIPKETAKSFVNIKTKLEGVAGALKRIDLIYASLRIQDPEQKSKFRKPGSGMFQLLKQELPDADIDMEKSFFVGDAAGRPQDHSADDLGFAENAKLKFYTPEEFFGETKPSTEAKIESKSKSESETKTKTKTKIDPEPESKPKPKPKLEDKTKSDKSQPEDHKAD